MRIYLTDGTRGGFYTAVFYAYNQRDCTITSDKNVQIPLDGNIVSVVTEQDKILRVIKKIDSLDLDSTTNIALALRNSDSRKEDVCLSYIRHLIKNGQPIGTDYSKSDIMDFETLCAQVRGEAHQMKGFLRFIETQDGTLYAPFAPEHDILELLLPHFMERYPAFPFVIHDTKRHVAAVCKHGDCLLFEMDKADLFIAENEQTAVRLWQSYYQAVNIKERQHEKQMRGYMPAKYWKFLPEKQNFEP